MTADRKEVFENRLEELGRRIQAIEDELASHNDPDWDDRAIERETDEVLEAMALSARTETAEIQQALARLNLGKYGECVRCGETISEARLFALPFTPICRVCAGAET